jgi:hypothetical protein
MKISKLIEQLTKAKDMYGDQPLTTYDGFIGEVKIRPAKDGISYPLKEGKQNEIGIEILTKWSA